ncbi:hypothetical protein COS75_03545 [Candidatus Pacearchaeota archaeon CG06_land_8_20_14_3_00_35_12]|nr:MAG: hypothetical protein COS75_03545 [Candidatus Pacearchaeota archaeon CG06_land_8_20_14_3_00_35_12]
MKRSFGEADRQCKTTYFLRQCLSEKKQWLVGSLAGAAPSRKDIERAQRQAHPGQKSGVECKGKCLSDCIPNKKECKLERVA